MAAVRAASPAGPGSAGGLGDPALKRPARLRPNSRRARTGDASAGTGSGVPCMHT